MAQSAASIGKAELYYALTELGRRGLDGDALSEREAARIWQAASQGSAIRSSG